MQGLIQLTGAFVAMALTLGPVVLWAALLNLRDRREARLLQSVLAEVCSRDLLGRVAVRVRSGVLRRRSVVAVHILGGARSELWEILTRLAQRLSPRVRLELTSQMDGFVPATLTVQARPARPFPRPSRPTLATSSGGGLT